MPLLCLAVSSLGPALLLAPKSRGQGRAEETWGWMSSCLPQLIPGSPCCRPVLSVGGAAACSPCLPSSSPFPSVLPPTHPFIKPGTTRPAAQQSTSRVSLFPPPQAEKQGSICQLQKELISMASAAAVDWGPEPGPFTGGDYFP